MHLYPRLTLLVFSLILFSCNSSKKVTSQEIKQPAYFIIGSGGGFTGLYTQYKIDDSGIIELYDFESKTYHHFHNVSKSKVKDFFIQIEELNLNKVDYIKPGNISDYIEVLTPEQTLNRIVWANSTSEQRPDIIQFYDKVMLFIKGLETE